MPTSIESSLKTYGFSDNEAILYQLLLRRIEATVFNLAQEAGIPRTTVYATLEDLKRKGFVTAVKKNNVLYYSPESPQRLLTILKAKEEALEQALPKMQALIEKSRIKPTTRLYSGKAGIKTVLNDIIETITQRRPQDLVIMSSPDVLEYLSRYFPKWIDSLVTTGIQRKLLLPDSARSAKAYYQDARNREVRFLPKGFPFQSSYEVYGNKIAFISIKGEEAFGLIVESANIAQMYRALFLFAWNQLPAELPAKVVS